MCIRDRFVKIGCYFSFCGYFLLDQKEKVRATFQTIPINRILIETDAPDQGLPEDKGRFHLNASKDGQNINHPGNIAAVYNGLAQTLGISIDKLIEQVANNYRRLFESHY